MGPTYRPSARRVQRTKSRGLKGLQLKVGARRAPTLLSRHNSVRICVQSTLKECWCAESALLIATPAAMSPAQMTRFPTPLGAAQEPTSMRPCRDWHSYWRACSPQHRFISQFEAKTKHDLFLQHFMQGIFVKLSPTKMDLFEEKKVSNGLRTPV